MLTLFPAVALLAGLAAAQDAVSDVDAQIYRIPIDARYTLWTDDAENFDSGTFTARLGLVYTRMPLIYVVEDAEGNETSATTILDRAFQGDAIAGYTLGRARLGVDLPVFFDTAGTGFAGGGGVGDLDFDLKLGLVDRDRGDDEDDRRTGFAVAGRVGLPTATVDAPVRSEGLTWEVYGILDTDVGENTHLAFNLGTRHVPAVQLAAVDWSDQLVARAGLGYELTDNGGLSADLAWHPDYGAAFSNHDGEPLELMPGFWSRLGGNWTLRGGVGIGLLEAVAAPTWRAVGVLSYEPWPEKEEAAPVAEDILVHLRIEDPQGNPVPGVRTEVALPEGPETGGDALDFEVPPGRYRMWADADGYRPLQSLVTVQPSPPEQEIVKVMEALAGKVIVRVRDIDDNPVPASFTMDGGEPVQAPGGEGATDAPPGEHAFVVTAPDYQPVRATAEVQAGQTTVILVTLPKFIRPGEGKLYLLDKVHFDFDKATIQPRSYRLLAEVARFIDDNPQVGRIRIEGHTDTMGSRAYNKDLSQRRAQAVYDYLTVTLGVPPARLDPPIGCGEDFNIEKLGDEVRSEANRRVEFIFAAKHPEACIAVTESPAEAPGGPVPTADQP